MYSKDLSYAPEGIFEKATRAGVSSGSSSSSSSSSPSSSSGVDILDATPLGFRSSISVTWLFFFSFLVSEIGCGAAIGGMY